MPIPKEYHDTFPKTESATTRLAINQISSLYESAARFVLCGSEYDDEKIMTVMINLTDLCTLYKVKEVYVDLHVHTSKYQVYDLLPYVVEFVKENVEENEHVNKAE